MSANPRTKVISFLSCFRLLAVCKDPGPGEINYVQEVVQGLQGKPPAV